MIQTQYTGANCPHCHRKLTLLLTEQPDTSWALCFHCRKLTSFTGEIPLKLPASKLAPTQKQQICDFIASLPVDDHYQGPGSQLRLADDATFHRRWLSLAEYERQFSETLEYRTPDLRTAPATCKWCGKSLPQGRRSFCKDSCSRNYTKVTFTKRSTPTVPYRIACRDDFRCQITGVDLAWHNRFGQRIPVHNGAMAIHHLIPVAQQGTDYADNLITLSQKAHLAYHQNDPEMVAKITALREQRLAGPGGEKMYWQ